MGIRDFGFGSGGKIERHRTVTMHSVSPFVLDLLSLPQAASFYGVLCSHRLKPRRNSFS